jgi:outer membrane lipoprotein SlyB
LQRQKNYGEKMMQARNGMLYPLMVIAAISVILLSIIGIAAMTGHLPNALSQKGDAQENAIPTDSRAVSQPEQQQQAAPAPVPAPAPVVAAPATPTKAERHAAPRQAAPIRHESVAATCHDCGVVESVQAEEVKGQGSGLGAVAGGIIGGVLGHQVGAGHGKDLATVAGAVGGGLAGNEVEKNVKKVTRYVIRVRMEDGSTRVVTQSVAPAVNAGDQVRIDGDHVVARG